MGSHPVKQGKGQLPARFDGRGPWWFVALIICGAIFLLASFDTGGFTWGLAAGQTVPRTPPPTWTRTRTAAPPETESPTLPPTATATLAPGAPTPVPQPDPAVSLNVTPYFGGPGDIIRFTVRLRNHGSAVATGLTVTLPWPDPLFVLALSASAGEVSAGSGEIVWRLGQLAPGAEAVWTLQAQIAADAMPDQVLRYRARLSFDGGLRESEERMLLLPWTRLPATGGTS